jgi:hypothetical protein
MRTVGRSFGAVGSFALLSLAIAVAGCGGDGDLGAMTGHQVLQGRDVKDLFFWRHRTLAFTRDKADPAQSQPQDFLVWPIDEPAPSMALAGVDWGYPSSWPIWFTGDVLVTGPEFERIYSVETRQSADLLTFLPPPAGDPPSYRQILAGLELRSDGHAVAKLQHGADADAIVVGRPPDLRVFSLPGVTVGGMAFVGADLALLINRTPSATDGLAVGRVGISRLDTSSGALTPLVAETSAPEWTGITGFCDDVDSPARCGFLGTIGCALDEPACDSGSPPPCMLLYAKADPAAGMKVAAYVQDLATGVSTRLAGDDIDQYFANRDRHLVAWGSTKNEVTQYWNYCGDTRGECPFPPGRLVSWRRDGAFGMYGPQDHLRIVDPASGACIEPDVNKTYSMYQAQWSGSGERMFWVAANDLGETSQTLWMADRDGGSLVSLSGGPSLSGTFASDGEHIYVSHDGESTASLGWIDLTSPSPAEKVLASNRGPIGVLGNRRALFVDHYNAQDDNGELVLVDLATGARQSLARAVTGVTVSGGEDEGADVAYTVRGRAAASRDGLWLTTLPP